MRNRCCPGLRIVMAGVVGLLWCGRQALAEDCNANGVDDGVDISAGTSDDCNGNGVPDECDIRPTFALQSPQVPVGPWPKELASGDFDGDGDLDLVVNNHGQWPPADVTGYVSVLRNAGDGTFTQCWRYGNDPFVDPFVRYPGGLAAGDLDADGDLDFAGTNHQGMPQNFFVFRNDGDCTFAGPYPYPLPSGAGAQGPDCLALGDVDGDNDLDVVVGNEGPPGTVCVFLNNGQGNFVLACPPIYVSLSVPSLALADLDRDGDLDLATVGYGVYVLFNNGGNCVFDPPICLDGSLPHDIVASDLDGDGDVDLGVTLPNSNQASVLLNNGSGGFGPPALYGVGTRPLGIVAVDLSGNGPAFPDLVIANPDSGNISVLFNRCDGTFWPHVAYACGANSLGVTAADFNSDRQVDLVASNTSPDSLSLFKGQPAHSTDLDCDGVPDECLPPCVDRCPLPLNPACGISIPAHVGYRHTGDEFWLSNRDTHVLSVVSPLCTCVRGCTRGGTGEKSGGVLWVGDELWVTASTPGLGGFLYRLNPENCSPVEFYPLGSPSPQGLVARDTPGTKFIYCDDETNQYCNIELDRLHQVIVKKECYASPYPNPYSLAMHRGRLFTTFADRWPLYELNRNTFKVRRSWPLVPVPAAISWRDDEFWARAHVDGVASLAHYAPPCDPPFCDPVVTQYVISREEEDNGTYAAVDQVSLNLRPEDHHTLDAGLRYQIYSVISPETETVQLFLAADWKVLATVYNGRPGTCDEVLAAWSSALDLCAPSRTLAPGEYKIYAVLTCKPTEQQGRQLYEVEQGGSRVEIGSLIIPELLMTDAVSRKTHGITPDLHDFDIELPLAPPESAGVECRKGGPTKVIISFNESVTPGVCVSSVGTCTDGPEPNQKTVTLDGVADESCVCIMLTGITDRCGNALAGDNDVHIRVLFGDVDGTGVVNIVDLNKVKQDLFKPLPDRFRSDVNRDGVINIMDLQDVKVALFNQTFCAQASCP